jgi:Retinoic acid induced 16-like protein/Family of unknown function (DUF5917)
MFLLKSVANFVAPPVNSRKEQLHARWLDIKREYRNDRPSLVAIEDNMRAIVALLLDEEAELVDVGEANSQLVDDEQRWGECFEFAFVEKHILQEWGELATRNVPAGVRGCVLLTVHSLLQNSALPLLPHNEVHCVLTKLFDCLAPICLEIAERRQLVALVRCVVRLLARQPQLAVFFLSDELSSSSSSPHATKLMVPECALFSMAASLATLNDWQAKRALVDLMPLTRQSDALAEAVARSDFAHTVVADELAKFFRLAPLNRFVSLAPASIARRTAGVDGCVDGDDDRVRSALNDEQRVDRLCDQMLFAVSIADSCHRSVCATLTHALCEAFLTPVLKPALVQASNDADAIGAIGFARALLVRTSSAPLQHAIADFLLADEYMLSVLVRRVDSLTKELSVATLALFDRLVELNSHLVMHHLVLKRDIGASSSSSSSPSSSSMVSASLLKIFDGVSTSLTSSSSFDAYLHDATIQVARCAEACARWPRGDESSASSSSSSSESTFLNAIVSRARHSLDLSFKENLLWTSIVAKMLAYPCARLHDAIVEQLLAALADVANVAANRASRMHEFDAQLANARRAMNDDGRENDLERDASVRDFDTRVFLQALLVVSECSVELAAIVQAKQVGSILEKRRS